MKGGKAAFERINVRRASTCQQVLSLLEATPSMPAPALAPCGAETADGGLSHGDAPRKLPPLVILDLLRPFYDTLVEVEERKKILGGCIENLSRLEKCAGGVVSVSPPRIYVKYAVEMFEMVKAAANKLYQTEIFVPDKQVRKFFSWNNPYPRPRKNS